MARREDDPLIQQFRGLFEPGGDFPDQLVQAWARRKNVTPAQLSLAWLTARKPWIVPIPGTTNMAHLEENAAAASITFTAAELKELDAALGAIQVQGARLSPAVLAATGVESAPKR